MQSLPLAKIPPGRTIVLLNKDDLPHRLPREATRDFQHTLPLRALHDVGINDLLATLRTLTGLATLDVNQPTPFTDRQQALLAALATAEEKTQTQSILQELLHG
jgi:tRNA U34 5-carboxymethylaminomethyl modifying GTPase MnmE/TrmE